VTAPPAADAAEHHGLSSGVGGGGGSGDNDRQVVESDTPSTEVEVVCIFPHFHSVSLLVTSNNK
jgi:hypothetical protein